MTGKRRGPRKEHKFVVRHQRKQELLKRALEEMNDEGETAAESAAVSQMIARLEDLIARRQRSRAIGESVKEQRQRLATRLAHGQ